MKQAVLLLLNVLKTLQYICIKTFKIKIKNTIIKTIFLFLNHLNFSSTSKLMKLIMVVKTKKIKDKKFKQLYVTDQGLIPREAYKNLAAIEYNLPHEYLVSLEK